LLFKNNNLNGWHEYRYITYTIPIIIFKELTVKQYEDESVINYFVMSNLKAHEKSRMTICSGNQYAYFGQWNHF